jgi:nucleoside-diphosphate-sugar epimerase
MNVLITGANGFLGTTIARQSLSSQISFRATDIHRSPVVLGIDYDPSDVTNPPTIKPLLKDVTVVIHTAGLAHIFDDAQAQKTFFNTINVTGTVNMMNAAVIVGVQHFILISSVSVYGPHTQGMYDENTPCNPVGPYALSKYNAELCAIEIARKSGMALTILRLATLYGEGDPGNVGRLIRMLDSRRFYWIGNGSNRKSLLYKEDAARACIAAIPRPASGINIYNVSAPVCSMCEIVDGIADALGKRPLPVRVPVSIALFLSRNLSRVPSRRNAGLHQTVQKWLSEDVYDTRRFEEAYGFQTKTSLKDGLKREVDWYRHIKNTIREMREQGIL